VLFAFAALGPPGYALDALAASSKAQSDRSDLTPFASNTPTSCLAQFDLQPFLPTSVTTFHRLPRLRLVPTRLVDGQRPTSIYTELVGYDS
jgi:hypothetical protein